MPNESSPVHRFVEPGKWHQDSWSCMLSKLAALPQLAKLLLHGGLIVCPELFRSIVEFAGEPFTSLVELEIQFAPETADGRWFFERDDAAFERSRSDPEYEDFWEEKDEEDMQERARLRYQPSDSLNPAEHAVVYEDGPLSTRLARRDKFRSMPGTATFLPFLLDAADAASKIRTLQKFILKQGYLFAKPSDMTCFPIVSRVFELWYLKAGMPRSPERRTGQSIYEEYPKVARDDFYVNRNRLYWRVDQWKPWDEVQAAWCTLAGPDAKVVFLDEHQWSTYSSGLLIYEGHF